MKGIKNIKLFDTEASYNAYINGSDAILPNVSLVKQTGNMGYNPLVPHDYSQDYFTIEALAGGTITWAPTNIVQYSLNDGDWTNWDSTNGLSVSANDKVRFKSNATVSYRNQFLTSSGNFDVYGNIMSLCYGDNFEGQYDIPFDYMFNSLFNHNRKASTLINAENLILPATGLTDTCYSMMFYNTPSLLTTPQELPATIGYHACYLGMFSYCTSITKSPIIRVDKAANSSQNSICSTMFDHCSSLNEITALGLVGTYQHISTSNFGTWVNSVAATGTFTMTSGANWSSGTDGIPSGWDVVEI